MAPPSPTATPLLELRGIRKEYQSGGPLSKAETVVAARDVTFSLAKGEAVALVGESGSGKSTLARLTLRLEAPDAGEIRLDGRDVLADEPRHASRAYRARVQMVFQDPFGSLNPVHSIAHHLARPLRLHGKANGDDVRARSLELLRTVGLEPAEDFLDRHPDDLSGGQRQRVAIARALAVEPDVLVADEPTSMLDVSIRMGVLNLLADLKRERGVSILLITHDLASAGYLADRILVLFRGRIVEDGPSKEVVDDPAHPYTRALLAAIADASTVETEVRSGGRPTANGPRGCPFASRCPDIRSECETQDPDPRSVGARRVRCHLYPEGAAAPGS